tara:strand:+ start:398 stop:622 length:225 start_codon:yes stop_codon:yes gene_type:complete
MKTQIENIIKLFAIYMNAETEVTEIINRIGILTQRMYEIKVKLTNPKINKLQKLIYINKLKKIENNLNDILNGR